MLTIQNKKLCEHCFAPISEDGVCTVCNGESNRTNYPAALPEGTILQGRYIIGKVLGKGGFGVTYLSYDATEEQRVAIKEYLPAERKSLRPAETARACFATAPRSFTAKRSWSPASTATRISSASIRAFAKTIPCISSWNTLKGAISNGSFVKTAER